MTRILIADDHPLFRAALTQALRELVPGASLIEAATLDEFEDLLMDIAPDLIMANHMTTDDLKKQTRDLIPAILWHRPDRQLAS